VADRDLLVRHAILRTAIVGLFLVLIVNLSCMMIANHKEYVRKAKTNRQVSVRWTAPRGRIYDRDGLLLAANVYIADIVVPRSYVHADSLDPVLMKLVTWFRFDPEATRERLLAQSARRGSLVLVANATPSQMTTVEEYGRELPGIRVEARPRRQYVYRDLMAHVVGYVGEVGPADIGTGDPETAYQQGDIIGKQGVEAAMEQVLRGRNGLKLEEVNASGRVVGVEPQWMRPVVAGQDVTIALSERLQSRLAAAIGERTACGVALDVRTGEVLAAYSNPSFNPDLLTGALTESQWRNLIEDPDQPFFNRIVQATYPPASLYKTVTSLAGLQARQVSTGSEM
jgi:penicillin-binding protein 2